MSQRLLFVESSVPLKASFEYFFRAIGFDVTFAASCGEANDLLERAYFDLAIINFDCAIVNGNGLAGELGRRGQFIPVIACTQDERKVLPSPLIAEVIYKPASVFQILEAIDKSVGVAAA